MPIKRIQLGGITRVPSDRMSPSGAVAESLNVCLRETELAPIMPPRNIAADLGLPQMEPGAGATAMYRAVYIHKVNGRTNYIYVKATDGVESLIAYSPDEKVIKTLEEGESFLDDTITSIGNTLVFSTSLRGGYALYKNGEYKYLGEDIPQVALSVKPNLYSEDARLDDDIIVENDLLSSLTENAEFWNGQIKLDAKDRNVLFDSTIKVLWDGMDGRILNSRYFRYPVFVRFALKLYDGSYVHHTVPIYVSGGNIRYKISYCFKTSEKKTCFHVEQDGLAYKIKVTLAEDKEVYQYWKDVIQSIDMFISAPLIYPLVNSELMYCHPAFESGNIKSMEMDFGSIQSSDEEKTSIRDLILDKTRLFYKVRSFSVDNLSELAAGVEISNAPELSYTEQLYTRESLPDDFRSNNTYIAERNYVINRRLHSIGITEVLGRGMSNLYGIVPVKQTLAESTTSYSFLYEITDNDGTKKYVGNKGRLLTEMLFCYPIRMGDAVGLGSATKYTSDATQLLFYPDSRCTGVYVIKTDGSAIRLKMTGHPYLNCAYYIGDTRKKLSDLRYSAAVTIPSESRKGESYKENYIFQTAVENPFYYPVAGRIKLASKVIALASISAALSQGQFGQFDLYAFTAEGIVVLKANDEGNYMLVVPLSRDVCVSPSAVASIDQAIVFITDKGVMLLSGSQIQCLSLGMAGKPYLMEENARKIMRRDFDDTLKNTATFMDYMKSTRTQVGYDYNGSRLLFVNEGFQYMYIYMLGTNSWHKYVIPDAYNSSIPQDFFAGRINRVKILNGYPECLMFCASGVNSLRLYDMSTQLDVIDEQTDVPCIVATRAFNLDEPDILKTINHLKIRGRYVPKNSQGKSRVSYVLLGSQNGMDFHIIKSLRGKSWKFFRVIVICTLKSTERISWIDIDYESRFTNKLR